MAGILTPRFFAHLALSRFVKKKKDTFIIIYGKPRSGKTNLGLNLLRNYLSLCRKANKKGLIDFKPPPTWRQIFKRYFTDSAEDMGKKLKNNEDASPVFLDEALDVLSWHDVLSKEQKDLVELLMKTGKKGNFVILITPNLGLLTKEILARAHYFFMIPREFRETGWNSALVFRNYDIPILAEKNPFGIYSLIKKVEKHPRVFSNVSYFISLGRQQNTYKGTCPFHFVGERLYNLYDKLVKEPSIMRSKTKRRYVTKERYDKLKFMFDTLLYNLHTRDGKSLAQIESLMIDKWGKRLLSSATIKKYVEQVDAMGRRPEFEEGETFEDVVEVKEEEEEEEDLPFDFEDEEDKEGEEVEVAKDVN